MLTMEMIEQARRFLDGKIRRTPVEQSRKLSEILGVPVWLKLECLQLTGSFKIRGAMFRLSQLTESEKSVGVATCSAGNHGKAMALSAKQLGVTVTVYTPSNVNSTKYDGMIALGARVVRTPYEGFDDAEAFARQQVQQTGQLYISAFDDPYIMAGNGGTLAAEVIEDVPDARTFIVPVGGGGLSAGFAYYAKERLSDACIVGCQHIESPSLKLSLQSGQAVTRMPAVSTLAGGVEGGVGKSTFEVLKTRTDRVALLNEKEILAATVWMLDNHQYLVEPTSAVTVAACLNGHVGKPKSPTAVVLSGRNVDIGTIKALLANA